ncbi:hypothetical protein CYMTET_39298 [Cymbomonas tetramitiformis]|uniref:Uncharacterized protein n=1 Tax=Cymbomonas tetramitiformis TaxID=36881 RepID=A0AAE0F4E2_9CHLO|nr:hypothetical protein CYMTET_39298 [Cymbomonas tetramitiformis]
MRNNHVEELILRLVKAGQVGKAVKRLEAAKLANGGDAAEAGAIPSSWDRQEAEGCVPEGVREWLVGAWLVVLLKDDLGANVRPIASRKLVAKNACNAVHRGEVLPAIKRDSPEVWAWPDLCYGDGAYLGFRLGSADGSVICVGKSREGAQQGGGMPLNMAAQTMLTMLEQVQEKHPEVLVLAYLDAILLVGPPVRATAAYATYAEAAAIGLHIQPAKSAAYSPEGGP